MILDKIDIQKIITIAKKAGEEILDVYQKEIEVTDKDDKSPLTEADRRANKVILDELTSAYPEIPFISEEAKETPYGERKDWPYFWLIDPLDGTKEFIKRNGEFTVNIALVERGTPVMGVVYIPVKDTTFYAVKGKGAYKQEGNNDAQLVENKADYRDLDSIKVVASRSHLSQEVVDFVDKLKAQGKEVDFISAGSSLKFCLVAEGLAHVYPRLAPTMEWDTGAAHIVVKEAGKKVLNAETGNELTYNKENLLNPFFIVE